MTRPEASFPPLWDPRAGSDAVYRWGFETCSVHHLFSLYQMLK